MSVPKKADSTRAEFPVQPSQYVPDGRLSRGRSPTRRIEARADGAIVKGAGHVSLVDPDTSYRAALGMRLRSDGFEVSELSHLDGAALETLSHESPDVALVSMEVLDAPRALSLVEMQSHLPGLPIAIVSKHAGVRLEERAFSEGASDFFARSRSLSIVAKRLSLLIGRRADASAGDEGQRVEAGTLSLDRRSHRAYWGGEEVGLTVTEYKIVDLLVLAGPEPVDCREIYDIVHGAGFLAGDGDDGYRMNVRSLIRKVRAKFRDIEPAFTEIETVPGVGYRWQTTDERTATGSIRQTPAFQSSEETKEGWP